MIIINYNTQHWYSLRVVDFSTYKNWITVIALHYKTEDLDMEYIKMVINLDLKKDKFYDFDPLTIKVGDLLIMRWVANKTYMEILREGKL